MRHCAEKRKDDIRVWGIGEFQEEINASEAAFLYSFNLWRNAAFIYFTKTYFTSILIVRKVTP